MSHFKEFCVLCVCVCACARACVRVCARACVRARVRVRACVCVYVSPPAQLLLEELHPPCRNWVRVASVSLPHSNSLWQKDRI